MKAKRQDKSEDNIVYVGIDEPVTIRRDILEASKSVIRVLKGQRNVHSIRMEKQKLIEELRAKVSELNRLVTETSQMLPHMDESSLPAQAIRRAEKPLKLQRQKSATQSGDVESHVDKFEKELQDIEDKLKSL